MDEKPGLEPGFFARRATGGLTATRCSRHQGHTGAMVVAKLAGLVLSTIFVSARNLTAPIIAHADFDA